MRGRDAARELTLKVNILQVFTIDFSEIKSIVNHNSQSDGQNKSAKRWTNLQKIITRTISLSPTSSFALLLRCWQRQGKHLLRLRPMRSIATWRNTLFPQFLDSSFLLCFLCRCMRHMLPQIWPYIIRSWGCLFPCESPPCPYISVRWLSTFDDWTSISSDESPCRTIPIRSWAARTHVSSICTDFPRYHRMESLTWIVELHPILYRIPEYCHHEEQQRKNSKIQYCVMSTSHSKVVVDHEGDLSSSKETDPLSGRSVPRDWLFSWTGNSGWSCSLLKQFSRRVPQSLVHEFLW